MAPTTATAPAPPRPGPAPLRRRLGDLPPRPPTPRLGGLDGLRGVAVALVVAYHLPLTVSVVPGGTLGVDVFFVLSGFLVTTVLLEHATAGSPGRHVWAQLREFWLRRAARLGPALLVLVAAWAGVWLVSGGGGIFNTAVGHPAGAAGVPAWVDLRGLLAVALYGYNWLAAGGTALPLAFGHLWSLAVEEQFYLVWPVALLAVLRTRTLRFALGVTAGLAVLSAVTAAAQSPARGYALSYFGTQSRAQQLLVGSLLAMCWSHGLVRLSRRAATVLGAVGALVLGVAVRRLDEHGWLGAHGGMTATAVAAGAVVVCIVCGGAGPGRWVRWAPLRWLGRRSYAVYLWSYPLTMWSAGMAPLPQAALVLGLSLGLAELSWRWVEAPAQRRVRQVRPAVADPRAEEERGRHPALLQPR
ncbi:MAG TPA: acyltransferase [Acidimicrobiales bacterium]|nr:acyltransferase [Acidimicrobiales bacterium]